LADLFTKEMKDTSRFVELPGFIYVSAIFIFLRGGFQFIFTFGCFLS